MEQRTASAGVHTIGSPRTLKLVVFTSTAEPAGLTMAVRVKQNQRVMDSTRPLSALRIATILGLPATLLASRRSVVIGAAA